MSVLQQVLTVAGGLVAAAYAAACANDGIRGAGPIRRCVLAEFERRKVNPLNREELRDDH